jgi:hypothetical protein
MSLDNIVNDNLEFLKNLKEEDKCKIIDNKLVNDDDSFQDIQSTNIELVIVNTLLLSLHKECSNLSEKDTILNDIDVSINNLYKNTIFNKLIDDSELFNSSLKNVDTIYDKFREKYQKNKCYRNLYYINDIFNIFLKNAIIVSKRIHKTDMLIRGAEYFIDSDEGDSDDNNVSCDEDNDNDNDNNDTCDEDNDDEDNDYKKLD